MTVHPLAHTGARLACCAAAIAMLSACATRTQISSQQESSIYRSHAGRTYTPPGPPGDPWGPYITEAAAKFDVPDRWIREVMRQESGGRLYHGGTLVTSGAGAMGLMQVIPATYDELRARYPELSDDPYDPHDNILAGTAYIREMYDIYGSPGFLAAYNAGPGRLDDYLTRDRILPEETRRYVAAIAPRIAGADPRTPSPGQQYALNAMPFSIPDGPRYASSRYSAPPGEPIRLSPQPDPVPAAPVQLADAAPSRGNSPYIVLRPQPVEVAEAPEPVRAASIVTASALPAPLPRPFVEPTPSYSPPPRVQQFAQLPEPPHPQNYFTPPIPPREPPRSQQQLAAAALVPLSPHGSHFSLFTPANAEPIGIHHTGFATGGWAVQVGAFANEGLASSATASARGHAREVLASAHTSVTLVREPHGMLYRARLTGLSRDSAAQACERLARTRTNCIIVSPDAQS